MKRLIVTLPALLALTPAAWADGPSAYGGGSWGYPMMGGGSFGFGFMGVGMMVIFWGVLIFLGYAALRWLIERNPGARRPDALDILKERLARGEIDPAEYEARRKVLEG